jgi:hypothetical protein
VCTSTLSSTFLTRSFAEKVVVILKDVHRKGIRWSDCRPDNIGIFMDENSQPSPLLLDWEAAVKFTSTDVPASWTSKSYGAQRLLALPPDQIIEPHADDDWNSLHKVFRMAGIEQDHKKFRRDQLLSKDNERPSKRHEIWRELNSHPTDTADTCLNDITFYPESK